MSDRIPSIADITNWLIDNPQKINRRGRKVPTGVPDAARALGYKGPPLKIREGNLTNDRESLRISLKGQSSRSDYFRAQAQARTTPDRSVRAGANRKIKSINGQSSVINTADHILSNGALANGEAFVRATRGEEGVRQMRERYQKAGVGYGHSKENIQGLTKDQNGHKEKQERTLRGNNKNKTAYLQHLENKPPVTSPEFPEWEQKKNRFVDKINLPNVDIPIGAQLLLRVLNKSADHLQTGADLFMQGQSGSALDQALNSIPDTSETDLGRHLGMVISDKSSDALKLMQHVFETKPISTVGRTRR